MDQHQIVQDILEINRRVCFNMWNVVNVNSGLNGLSPRLILPQKRTGEIRISEQESRVLYCGILNSLNYFYSIETPTEDVYQQKGKTPQSAASDLSIYINCDNEFEKVANVEFKAHNPQTEDIRKDIEKLIKEKITGNWFHTLKNVDNKTILTLFRKFKDSFLSCSSDITAKLSFVFCFCILEKKWACMKEFNFDPNQDHLPEYIDSFFTLDYSVNASSTAIHVNDFNDWIVLELAIPRSLAAETQ